MVERIHPHRIVSRLTRLAGASEALRYPCCLLWPLRRVLLQEFHDEDVERLRHSRVQFTRPARGSSLDRGEQLRLGSRRRLVEPRYGRVSREGFVQDEAKRVEIGGGLPFERNVVPRGFRVEVRDVLRSEVGQGAYPGSARDVIGHLRPGNPEVDDGRLAAVRDEDVLAFQVPVDDPELVHVGERVRHLLECYRDPGERWRHHGSPLLERRAVDEVHHQVGEARLHLRPAVEGVNTDDARVTQALQRRDLAVESLDRGRPVLLPELAELRVRDL